MSPSATWYFDFISPFAYLQLPTMLALRERLDITPKPVLLGALLAHHGQLGPAEIAGKREFTYRFVQWQAERAGIVLRFPPAHPFNPLAALRLCLAAGANWNAVTMLFEHFWAQGRSGVTPGELARVGQALGIADVAAAIADPGVKAALRTTTGNAIAHGVFGVPILAIGTTLFWGNDATSMVEAFLDDPERFESAEFRRLANLPAGVRRKR